MNLRTPMTAALSAALLMTAGCGEESTEREPQAQMIMLHTSGVLGEVVFRVDGEPVARLAPGGMTSPVGLPVGPIELSVRNPGAATDLIGERLDLRAQPYVVAVVGQSLGELEFWKVDEPAPDLASGKAALKVVNLDQEGYTYDIYVEDDQGVRRPLVESLMYSKDSSFATLSLPTTAVGTSEPLQIKLLGFDTGDNPEGRPEIETDLELRDGVPYMALIQTEPRSGSPYFNVITAR